MRVAELFSRSQAWNLDEKRGICQSLSLTLVLYAHYIHPLPVQRRDIASLASFIPSSRFLFTCSFLFKTAERARLSDGKKSFALDDLRLDNNQLRNSAGTLRFLCMYSKLRSAHSMMSSCALRISCHRSRCCGFLKAQMSLVSSSLSLFLSLSLSLSHSLLPPSNVRLSISISLGSCGRGLYGLSVNSSLPIPHMDTHVCVRARMMPRVKRCMQSGQNTDRGKRRGD